MSAIALTEDIKSVSEIVGHAGVNITLSLYAHSALDQKEKLMDKMNALILETNRHPTVVC